MPMYPPTCGVYSPGLSPHDNGGTLNVSAALLVIAFTLLWIPLDPVTALADEPVAQVRLTAAEIAALAAAVPANPAGPTMTVLVGDPKLPGLYTVRVAIPAHTQVKPHTHRDNRSVTVLSGTWQMGYGTQFDAKLLKELQARESVHRARRPAALLADHG